MCRIIVLNKVSAIEETVLMQFWTVFLFVAPDALKPIFRGASVMMFSSGYVPNADNSQNTEIQLQLFSDHLPLILEREREILNCADYFFCSLDFAFCSWAWAGGDGPLYLGYLLLGWRDRLTGVCPACGDTVLVTSFGGSILSGSNGWCGHCRGCHTKQNGRWERLGDRWQFVRNLRQSHPHEICEWEEYDGLAFSWGGNGLQPGKKKSLLHRPLANPVNLTGLIEELKSGTVRTEKCRMLVC
jgi:hypothetical protein